jgi:hypothetical protein
VNSFMSTNGETHGTSQHAKLILTMTLLKSAEKQIFMILELHLKLFTTISTQQVGVQVQEIFYQASKRYLDGKEIFLNNI